MKEGRKIVVFIFLFLLSGQIVKGQPFTVRGRILNSEDSNPVSGCVVSLNPGAQISVTNLSGEFILRTNGGKIVLLTQILGFKQAKSTLYIDSDTIINLTLEVEPFKIKEVTIFGDSVESIERSENGSIILTRASLNEMPQVFSEPDLIKSIQNLPGVVPGRDGTTDIFVRGGTPGQNVFLVNGCYIFIPSHLLGITSSFDLDFIDKTELIKDYFSSEIGGGASSVVKIDYRVPKRDSAGMQLRAGVLTSGLTFQIPFKKAGIGITGGIKRGNYSIYAPLLKTLIDKNVSESLPPNNYSFYDSYIRITHSSSLAGSLSYVFMRNYDNGSRSNTIESKGADTLFTSEIGFNSSWTNQVHSLQWYLPVKSKTKWIYDLNFNKISIQKENFLRAEKFYNNTLIGSTYNSYRFSPEIINIGTQILFAREVENIWFSGGIYYRFRDFKPNIVASYLSEETSSIRRFVEGYKISEPAAFISGKYKFALKWSIEGGIRLSSGITDKTVFLNFEPRLRFTHKSSEYFSQHINFVRLSQSDHQLESSNTGLRSVLWLPVSNEFGPEISNVYSSGINGQIRNYFWSMDLYYKTMQGIVDFKPGASFLYATSINDMLDKIEGRSYGLEMFLVKRIGKLTGNIAYTYSRSKRDWFPPEGRIWIPSVADRPHNVNISLKYYLKKRTSLGLSWVFISGLPATMYVHSTYQYKWFETKNNIRYPDYHRLDLSFRKIFKIKKTLINFDFDISNVYNRRNTFYIKEVFDESRNAFIYKNFALFPIMPSFSLNIQKSWNMN